MAFEKFTDTGRRSFKPKVSIRKSGVIGFSAAAVDKFKLKDCKFVTLYYDRDTRTIGIQGTREEEEGSHPLIMGPQSKSGSVSGSVSASRFLDRYEIMPPKNVRFDATWDDLQGMVLLRLP
jgi:hypothetical protein